jgi:hypothetical protein
MRFAVTGVFLSSLLALSFGTGVDGLIRGESTGSDEVPVSDAGLCGSSLGGASPLTFVLPSAGN